MGFYFRRSVSVGPFRFNLSTGGVGMSVGVKGFRVGTGPRGNYVHMGRGGLYFRSALPGPVSPRASAPSLDPTVVLPAPMDPTLGPSEEIESADAVQLTDSSSSDLVQQISEKAHVTRLLPIVVGLAVLAGLALGGSKAPPWTIGALAVATIILAILAARRDTVAKAVVLLYDLDEQARAAYEGLHTAFEGIQGAGRTWHIKTRAVVHDRKYHAGASNVMDRDRVLIRKGAPPILKTNVEVVLLPAGRQLLAFMPDRLLIFDRGSVAGINYSNLSVEVSETRFIEEEAPPQDAKIVDSTWRYVNKKGGPDRRFSNNRQLPIALYEKIHLQSGSGLNELFHCSRLGTGKSLQNAVTAISKISEEMNH